MKGLIDGLECCLDCQQEIVQLSDVVKFCKSTPAAFWVRWAKELLALNLTDAMFDERFGIWHSRETETSSDTGRIEEEWITFIYLAKGLLLILIFLLMYEWLCHICVLTQSEFRYVGRLFDNKKEEVLRQTPPKHNRFINLPSSFILSGYLHTLTSGNQLRSFRVFRRIDSKIERKHPFSQWLDYSFRNHCWQKSTRIFVEMDSNPQVSIPSVLDDAFHNLDIHDNWKNTNNLKGL